MDALLDLEAPDRLGGVSGFVNVSRHRPNLLANRSVCRFFRWVSGFHRLLSGNATNTQVKQHSQGEVALVLDC